MVSVASRGAAPAGMSCSSSRGRAAVTRERHSSKLSAPRFEMVWQKLDPESLQRHQDLGSEPLESLTPPGWPQSRDMGSREAAKPVPIPLCLLIFQHSTWLPTLRKQNKMAPGSFQHSHNLTWWCSDRQTQSFFQTNPRKPQPRAPLQGNGHRWISKHSSPQTNTNHTHYTEHKGTRKPPRRFLSDPRDWSETPHVSLAALQAVGQWNAFPPAAPGAGAGGDSQLNFPSQHPVGRVIPTQLRVKGSASLSEIHRNPPGCS